MTMLYKTLANKYMNRLHVFVQSTTKETRERQPTIWIDSINLSLTLNIVLFALTRFSIVSQK